jgi:phage baseplate assembly protein W
MYLQFPWKLHEMLRDAEKDSSIVSWLPHGKGFRVHKPQEFVQKVMPVYFRQSHYKSFQRQLNLWGFERVGKGEEHGAYYHKFFVRGEPGLCGYMNRQKIKGAKTQENPSSELSNPVARAMRRSLPSDWEALSRSEKQASAALSARRGGFSATLDASSIHKPNSQEGKAAFNPLAALAALASLAGNSSTPSPLSAAAPTKQDSKPSAGSEKKSTKKKKGYSSSGLVASSRSSFPALGSASFNNKSSFPMAAGNAARGSFSKIAFAKAPSVIEGKQPPKEGLKVFDGTRKPRRPMSAYNIFFEHQRKRLVAGETKLIASEEFIQSIECILLSTEDEGVSSPGEAPLGADLSQEIAQQWKTIDPVNKAILDCYAQQEMRRYETEVRMWREQRDENLKSPNLAQAPVPVPPSTHSGDVVGALRQYADTKTSFDKKASTDDAPLSPISAYRAQMGAMLGSDNTASMDAQSSIARLALPFGSSHIGGLRRLSMPDPIAGGMSMDLMRHYTEAGKVEQTYLNPQAPKIAEKSIFAESNDASNPEVAASPSSARGPLKKRRASMIEATTTSNDILNNNVHEKLSSKKAKSFALPEHDETGADGSKDGNEESTGDASLDDASSAQGKKTKVKRGPYLVKRGGWKKPQGKPKRPLSAYNMFFTYQRNRIVAEEEDEQTLEAFKKGVQDILGTPKERRVHRKTCTGIGFQDLARRIAEKWKAIDPEQKAVLDGFANEEMSRYKEAVKVWKDKEAESEVMSPEPSTEDAKPEASELPTVDDQGDADEPEDNSESNKIDPKSAPKETLDQAQAAALHDVQDQLAYIQALRAQANLQFQNSHQNPLIDLLRGIPSQVPQMSNVNERPILGFLRGNAQTETLSSSLLNLEQSRAALKNALQMAPTGYQLSHSLMQERSIASLMAAGYPTSVSAAIASQLSSQAYGRTDNSALSHLKFDAQPSQLTAEIQIPKSSTKVDQKKPKDKPKRPLSSYNIYYQLERNKIVDGRQELASIDELVQNIENILYTRKEKRPHRKTHGTISFQELSREIANNWKTIEPGYKSLLDTYAAKDLDRYRNDLQAWELSKTDGDAEDGNDDDADEESEFGESPNAGLQSLGRSAVVNEMLPSSLLHTRTSMAQNGSNDAPFPAPFGAKNEKQQAMPFPFALHNMLYFAEVEGLVPIVSWLPHGRAFRVKNKELFVAKMMSTYFKQTKFKSFQRQLNLWGFTRITDGADAGAYYHKYFIRSEPALCKLMTRQKIKGAGASAHHQAYSSSIDQAKASDEAVAALCSLSTLASAASASEKAAPKSKARPSRAMKVPPLSVGLGNCDVSTDSPSENESAPKSRERAIFLSNMALQVVGE